MTDAVDPDEYRQAIGRLVSGVTVVTTVADGIDHAMTANAISGMCVDVARWYIAGDRWTPERIADHFAGIALRMVAAG